MNKSKVYFTNMKTSLEENLPMKFQRLIKEAGIQTIDFDRKFVAIKIHFGELGNMAYLRPNYAKALVDVVKSLGGNPFLTDCSTLYVGSRKNALDHLDTAYVNGFSPFSTGCHVLIADGLKGTDDVLVPVEGGEYIKEAKVGRAIMDADILISLSHFKGHEMAGIGGAVKNIGMGCGSRAGKMEMHASGKPEIFADNCVACRKCLTQCAHSAITIVDKKAVIDHDRCVGCGRCISACMYDAVYADNDEGSEVLNKKIVEYTTAILKDRPHFHVSLAIDISPFCDCHAENDVPIAPNIGMFASFDPVALDAACANAVNAAPVGAGSVLEGKAASGDKFHDTHPTTNWQHGTDHAVKMGLGNKEYELITI